LVDIVKKPEAGSLFVSEAQPLKGRWFKSSSRYQLNLVDIVKKPEAGSLFVSEAQPLKGSWFKSSSRYQFSEVV